MIGKQTSLSDNKGGWIVLCVTLIAFVFTYVVFGFYYVDYEALHNSFFSGKLTPGFPFRSIYFLMHHGTSYIYSALYEHFPYVEWISWFLCVYFFLATYLGLYIVWNVLGKETSTFVKIGCLLVIYFLVFADTNIHFIYTRISYFIVGISFIGLIYFFNSWQKIKERPVLFICINLLFTIGALCRMESSMALSVAIFPFALVYTANIRQSVVLFLYPGIFLGIFFLSISHDIKTSTEFYKQIEPEIEVQFVERQNKIPLSAMKSLEDSVKYNLAADIAWVDPHVITPQFMRSMIREEAPLFTDARQWKRVWEDMRGVMTKYPEPTIFSFILAGFIFFLDRKMRYKWLLYVVFFWLWLLVQAYMFKINDRSFLPNISLFIFIELVLLLRVYYEPMQKNIRYALLVAVFIFLVFQVRYLRSESNILASFLADYRHNTEQIKKVAKDKYLVLNSSSFDYLFLSHEPFYPFDYSDFKKTYITDGHVIPFLPYYRRYLESECKCDVYEFPSFWTYLKSIRSEVVIMSTPHRMILLRDYLKVMYHYQLNLEEIQSVEMLKLRKSEQRDVLFDFKMYTLKADTLSAQH